MEESEAHQARENALREIARIGEGLARGMAAGEADHDLVGLAALLDARLARVRPPSTAAP